MSRVKWADPHELTDEPERFTTMPVIPLSALTEVVEGLRENIAHSFINTDEISAYRLACEHILTQFEAPRKEN